jgi:hypothetical protein
MGKLVSLFWKAIAGAFKLVIVFSLILFIIPLVYFAWRAGQPMSMPDYGGRSYYQVLAERQQAYDDLS